MLTFSAYASTRLSNRCCALFLFAGLSLACIAVDTAVAAATVPTSSVDLQRRANGVLMIMGYSLTPDVTTGSLAISNQSTGNPGLSMVSLGGGDVVIESLPLYLEGTLALSRYDPTFVAASGTGSGTSPVPVHWNSISGTGGIGWNFAITERLKLRPIFNLSLGHVESDLSLAGRVIEQRSGREFEFLQHGRLNAIGLGGSVMLDYEDYRPEREIDAEFRYTNILLRSFHSSQAVEGRASSQSTSLWLRQRTPTGLSVFDRPLRSVVEFAHTQFLSDLRGALGFQWLSSVGAGLEVDASKYDIFVSRLRIVGRYQFGDNVRGWSIGVAVSF
jgi:hypothetical protein